VMTATFASVPITTFLVSPTVDWWRAVSQINFTEPCKNRLDVRIVRIPRKAAKYSNSMAASLASSRDLDLMMSQRRKACPGEARDSRRRSRVGRFSNVVPPRQMAGAADVVVQQARTVRGLLGRRLVEPVTNDRGDNGVGQHADFDGSAAGGKPDEGGRQDQTLEGRTKS